VWFAGIKIRLESFKVWFREQGCVQKVVRCGLR
jgi:hypothetical protein